MWLLALFAGVGPGLVALRGRTRRAIAWSAAEVACSLLVLVTVRALAGVAVLGAAALIDGVVLTIRRVRGERDGVVAAAIAGAPVGAAVLLLIVAVREYRVPSSAMCPTIAIGDHVLAEHVTSRWRAPAPDDVIVFVAPGGRDFIKRVVAVGGDVVAVKDGVLSVNGKATPTRALGDTTYANQDEATGAWSDEPVRAFDEELDGHHHTIFLAPREGGVYDHGHDFPQPEEHMACEDASPRHSPDRRGVAEAEGWPVMTTVPGGCKIPDGAVFVLGDNRDNSSDSRVWGPVPLDRIEGRVIGVWWPLRRAGGID
jgi:signal peptidase I